ncbi:MAG: 50S ribosomal protein L1 [Anaerolineales bacterium]
MAKHGKKYQEAFDKVDRTQFYAPEDALGLVKENAYAKFDETVEVHLRLGVDPRHAEQQVRETVMMPHGLGKKVTVVVFAEGEAARAAQDAGADYVADDELIEKIQDGWAEFDAAVATPQMMGTVGRLGRVLGPRGLMPNPKAGTVVPEDEIGRVIDELKSGRVEFRVDRTANLHVPIGKVSFEVGQLVGNMTALMEAVKRARPAAAKGVYVRSVTVASTMGPGIKVDPMVALGMG